MALGDSVTEGVGDPSRQGLRGWIHYLTTENDELALVANLARSGATVAEVRDRQLERALALNPDLVTCAIGVNDVLAGGFDAGRFEEDYDHVVGALAGTATTGVLTMALHDFTAGLPLSRSRRTDVRLRIDAANAVIERVSARYGAWLIDAREAEALDRSGMLSIDRLHPNRRGHRYIAVFAREVLRTQGVLPAAGAGTAPPRADPVSRRVVAGVRHAAWLCGHICRAWARGWRTRPRQRRAAGTSGAGD